MKKIIFLVVIALMMVSCNDEKKTNDFESIEVTLPVEDVIQEVEVIDDIKQYINYSEEGDYFELPIWGATGFPLVDLNFRRSNTLDSEVISVISAGMPFRILSESGDWWQVEYDNQIGYLYHDYCMINLPDVMPSIVYDITNSYKSLLKSDEFMIPDVTNKKLYQARYFNERFDESLYTVPVLYETAKKIDRIQKKAIQEGNTLVIYEAFRPRETQEKIVSKMKDLIESEDSVREKLTQSGWSLAWFINTGVSNHQLGIALDVSLAKIEKVETAYIGDYEYKHVSSYTEYTMPTLIHNLSLDALTYSSPVSSLSKEAWKSATSSDKMNDNAILLQSYFTEGGFTPLASEWWHFNDLDHYEMMKSINVSGTFSFKQGVSKIPESIQ
ncbi:hypothetical protein EZV73_20475 [Acidaminobacter sp. JC074]|uniref:SH3 domain-containing protein n=1 Tax=Acidaminobacter sp. JC074 TaxID=2530199 RepID=UPI001F0DF799|nr:SH3 domain-containing protein [Acidaminobacter sp. JC074]MCH4889967.1 hypothetical protein [Acidaminobacter sp. JC074]